MARLLWTGLLLGAMVAVNAFGSGAAVNLDKQLPSTNPSIMQTPGCIGLGLPTPSVGVIGSETEESIYCLASAPGDVVVFTADTTDRVTTSDLWAGACRTASYSGCFGTGARFADDEVRCTFPPPAYACPRGTVVATGPLFIIVGTWGVWGGDWDAGPYPFKVTVTVNGAPASLDLYEVSGPETGP